MAFGAHRATAARRLAVGDQLLMYTSRSCFHNPTRDRGRVIGRAAVTSLAEPLVEPVAIAGRSYAVVCDLHIERLAPYRTGVELAPLVGMLDAFPDPRSWSAHLRQPLVRLSADDAALVRHKLDRVARDPALVLDAYR
jgi:hypothetical protein